MSRTLMDLGWDARFERSFESCRGEGTVAGRVSREGRDRYTVWTECGDVAAKPAGRRRRADRGRAAAQELFLAQGGARRRPAVRSGAHRGAGAGGQCRHGVPGQRVERGLQSPPHRTLHGDRLGQRRTPGRDPGHGAAGDARSEGVRRSGTARDDRARVSLSGLPSRERARLRGEGGGRGGQAGPEAPGELPCGCSASRRCWPCVGVSGREWSWGRAGSGCGERPSGVNHAHGNRADPVAAASP